MCNRADTGGFVGWLRLIKLLRLSAPWLPGQTVVLNYDQLLTVNSIHLGSLLCRGIGRRVSTLQLAGWFCMG